MKTMFQRTWLNNFVSNLCERLIDAGFVVYRYDAYSTDSIYLKLDYGVCNSIRISDHKGKGYLKYRYNIGSNIDEAFVEKDKYDRYYYPMEDVDKMIEQILSDREDKLSRYGKERYESYMEKNKNDNKNNAGFWSQSRRVL